MIKKLISYKKFNNLINFKLFETKYGFLLSLITIIFSFKILDVYANISIYKGILISFLSNIIFAFIGLIGLLLSAMSITLSIVNKNIKSKIKDLNEEDSIEYIIYDFIFIALLLAIEIFIAIICLFSLKSNLQIINKIWFIVLTFIVIYIFYYVILGCVNLLHQCYRLFIISLQYNDIIKLDKRLKEEADKFEKDYNDLLNRNLSEIGVNYLKELIKYTKQSELNEHKKMLYIEYYQEKYNK